MIVRIFLAIGAIIAYALALITFIGTSTSTSLSNFTINILPENKTDESGTNASEIEPPQDLTPPESLTLGGISPQGGSDLSIACSWSNLAHC
jgi:hypothetical protein